MEKGDILENEILWQYAVIDVVKSLIKVYRAERSLGNVLINLQARLKVLEDERISKP